MKPTLKKIFGCQLSTDIDLTQTLLNQRLMQTEESNLRQGYRETMSKPGVEGSPIPREWGNGNYANGESTTGGTIGTAQEDISKGEFSEVKPFNRVQPELGGREVPFLTSFFLQGTFSTLS